MRVVGCVHAGGVAAGGWVDSRCEGQGPCLRLCAHYFLTGGKCSDRHGEKALTRLQILCIYSREGREQFLSAVSFSL